MCSFCNTHEETIYHILWECSFVQDLLNIFYEYCRARGIAMPRNPISFIFGLNIDIKASETYSIFLVLKSYVYRKRCLDGKLSIHELLVDIKTYISTLKYIATKNNELEDFKKKWKTWIYILNIKHADSDHILPGILHP